MTPRTDRLSDFDRVNKKQYDFVTDAWKIIFGDNFHIGYFQSGDETYRQATDNLVFALADMGHLSETMKVLDVGCGIGGPALLLHERFGCDVLGITISEIGVQVATAQASSRGYEAHVTFKLASAQDSRLPDDHFDLVWAMESFHLMPDKRKAFAECHRVLKRGGQFLLSDNMVGRKLSISELVENYKEMRLLERVFGKMQHETLAWYARPPRMPDSNRSFAPTSVLRRTQRWNISERTSWNTMTN